MFRIVDESISMNGLKLMTTGYYEQLEELYHIKLYNNNRDVYDAVTNPLNNFVDVIETRGGGKTFSIAFSLHDMARQVKTKIITFAPKYTQSKRILQQIFEIDHNIKSIDQKSSSTMRIQFKSGSTIEADSANEYANIEGNHGECFDGNTYIETDKGKKKIKTIVENKQDYKIKCYNETTKSLEYKPITAFHKNKRKNRKMLKISFEATKGKIKEIICTEDHMIHTDNRGWVQAKDLNLEIDVISTLKHLVQIDANKKAGHESYKRRGSKSSKTQIMHCEFGITKSWQKGETKYTDERVRHISDSLIGHPVSEKVRYIFKTLGNRGSKKGRRVNTQFKFSIIKKCQNCKCDMKYTGTPNAIKRFKDKKYCYKCSKKIGQLKTTKTRMLNGSYENIVCNFKHFKSGMQQDLGHYTRSSWETNYCRILKHLNIEYKYEPVHFKLKYPNGDIHNYTPDIRMKNHQWIEIKGQFNAKDILKIKLFKEQYPEEKIKILGLKDKYNDLIDIDYITLMEKYKDKIKMVNYK